MANICPLFSEVFDDPAQVLIHKSTVMYIYLTSCTGWCFSAAGGLFVSCSCEEWQMKPSLWQFGRTVCRRGCFHCVPVRVPPPAPNLYIRLPPWAADLTAGWWTPSHASVLTNCWNPDYPALHCYNKSSLGSAFISIYLWSIKGIHREDLFLF